MKTELTKKALEKIGNPNILVNLVSRRVRQLTSGGGSGSRPLISETAGMGAGDIALTEIIEGKMGWEFTHENPLAEIAGTAKKKKKG